MFRKAIVIVTLIALLNLVVGCTRSIRLFPEEELGPRDKITGVVLPSGETITFDRHGGRYAETTRRIMGVTSTGERVAIALEDVLYLQVTKADPVMTTVAALGVMALAAAVLGVIVALTKESCPFIYSWDGQQFVLDAEPLGGAVCEGLRRSDYSRLDHLEPVDGRYRLLVRNEVSETQYLDHVKLLVVDHPAGYEAISDTVGNLYLVGETMAPFLASDENGTDLLPFVTAADGIAWQSRLPVDTPASLERPRHHLTFKFPRPVNAQWATLVTNVGTTLWGSNMIREMLQLRGAHIEDWYSAIKERDQEYDQMNHFIDREELWRLQLYVVEGDATVPQGMVPGAGPLVIENRVLFLDLSGVEGDTLTIQFNPPFGFWVIDYLAVRYDSCPTPTATEVPLLSAVDHEGRNITDTLAGNDSLYHRMPQVGEWCKLTFEAPPIDSNVERTVFLESSGYYVIHFDPEAPPQLELLTHIGLTPGAAVQFAFDKYLEWLAEIDSRN